MSQTNRQIFSIKKRFLTNERNFLVIYFFGYRTDDKDSNNVIFWFGGVEWRVVFWLIKHGFGITGDCFIFIFKKSMKV